jgi:hypothetical protein
MYFYVFLTNKHLSFTCAIGFGIAGELPSRRIPPPEAASGAAKVDVAGGLAEDCGGQGRAKVGGCSNNHLRIHMGDLVGIYIYITI